jgi:glyoxylase-like metal-dependent hydrolase (beta-lactamase superfamily II)
MERSTRLGIASAAIPAVAGFLWSNDTSAASDISLSDKVIALKPSVTNCFLVRCNGGYLLIDVPYPGKYDSLLECLSTKNVDLSSIRYLLLTHHHG